MSYPSIPEDVIIDIQVSGYFYRQIVNNLLLIGDTKTPEEFSKALKSMEGTEPPKDQFELSVRTLAALIYEIELKAKAQNKTITTEVEIDDATGELVSTVDPK
jgi:hypothetical protein